MPKQAKGFHIEQIVGLIEATGERRAVVGGKPSVVMRVGRQ